MYSFRSRKNIGATLTGVVATAGLALPVSAQEVQVYRYDALGRLVQVTHSGGPNSNTAASYAYDAAGNRISVAVNAPNAPSGPPATPPSGPPTNPPLSPPGGPPSGGPTQCYLTSTGLVCP